MSFYQGKIALVTGAAGFIGSHLTDALLSQGVKVIGVDNFITGSKKNIEHLSTNSNFRFIEADVTRDPHTYLSTSELLPLISNLSFVFHFASPASPPGYQEHPIETYLVNSMGTHQLLQWVKNSASQARFLFASTSEVYGDPLEHPQKETYFGNVNPNGVRSMYDESKRMGETICGVHTNTLGLDTRIIRIFNTYGPRMNPLDGRSLVEFCVRILRDQGITLNGDGNQTRSYCYISDLVRGILLVMEHDKAKGETINLGNPHEVTMNALIQFIEVLTNKKATITFGERRPDDPRRRCPDISKALAMLSWEPTINLEQGLQYTLEYFKSL